MLTSLKNLRTSYVDLYLIHWPGAQGIPESSPENSAKRIDTWKKLIELHAGGQGVLKTIGVSNYLPRHLEETVTSTGVPPAVNQVFIAVNVQNDIQVMSLTGVMLFDFEWRGVK